MPRSLAGPKKIDVVQPQITIDATVGEVEVDQDRAGQVEPDPGPEPVRVAVVPAQVAGQDLDGHLSGGPSSLAGMRR